jgi:hypothetical protein
VSRAGHVTERGEHRGTVERRSAGWIAIDAAGTCDLVAYGTRKSAARSLLRGCIYGLHESAGCNCH